MRNRGGWCLASPGIVNPPSHVFSFVLITKYWWTHPWPISGFFLSFLPFSLFIIVFSMFHVNGVWGGSQIINGHATRSVHIVQVQYVAHDPGQLVSLAHTEVCLACVRVGPFAALPSIQKTRTPIRDRSHSVPVTRGRGLALGVSICRSSSHTHTHSFAIGCGA